MQNQHKVQMLILRELLFNPHTRFTDLNIAGLTSDHFTYHVKRLMKDGYIEKIGGEYLLTAKGKEYANRMDTEKLVNEKQPKVTVIVIATKYTKGEGFLLVQTRQKEPYFGARGFISGKVRFGETILKAAKRELLEETGLSANFKHKYILHEHIYSEEGKLLEDKFFYVTEACNTKGKLKSTRAGKNTWIGEKEVLSLDKLFYDVSDILKWFKDPKEKFIEKSYYIDKF